MTLDFAAKPRVHRSGEGKVNIHKKVQPCENHQMLVIFTAIKWGCKNHRFTLKERNLIKDAACRTIAYDYGYQKPFGRQRIEKWVEQIDKVIKYGPSPSSTPTANPLASKHKGSVAYLETIKMSNPGYVRRLFRYAQKIRGTLASYAELADAMNSKSAVELPPISASRKQVNKWFTKEGGKEFAPTTKPLDTAEHIKKRMIWVRKYFELLTNKNSPIAYLNEKWFYTTNRRRRIKKLPRSEEEAKDVDFIVQPKV